MISLEAARNRAMEKLKRSGTSRCRSSESAGHMKAGPGQADTTSLVLHLQHRNRHQRRLGRSGSHYVFRRLVRCISRGPELLPIPGHGAAHPDRRVPRGHGPEEHSRSLLGPRTKHRGHIRRSFRHSTSQAPPLCACFIGDLVRAELSSSLCLSPRSYRDRNSATRLYPTSSSSNGLLRHAAATLLHLQEPLEVWRRVQASQRDARPTFRAS